MKTIQRQDCNYGNYVILYLNDGRGEAWAGQDNDKATPEGCWYVSDFLLLENLGAVPPIGSMQDNEEIINT